MQKIRELEVQLLDHKSQTDRRFNSFMEEIPNKMDREMKRMEQKSTEVSKGHSQQASITAEQVSVIRDQLIYQLESVNDRYSQIKVKVDEQEFKLGNLSRNLEAMRNNYSNVAAYNGGGGGGRQGLQGYDSSSNSLLNQAELETEVKILRNHLQDEKAKRDQLFFEQSVLVTQLQQ